MFAIWYQPWSNKALFFSSPSFFFNLFSAFALVSNSKSKNQVITISIVAFALASTRAAPISEALRNHVEGRRRRRRRRRRTE